MRLNSKTSYDLHTALVKLNLVVIDLGDKGFLGGGGDLYPRGPCAAELSYIRGELVLVLCTINRKEMKKK